MLNLRHEIVRDHERLLDAIERLHGALDTLADTTRSIVDLVDGHARVSDAMVAVGAAKVRQDTNEALDEFERTRHAARLGLVEAAVTEGMSMSEIGRVFGFSRQLAGRHAAEVGRLRAGRVSGD